MFCPNCGAHADAWHPNSPQSQAVMAGQQGSPLLQDGGQPGVPGLQQQMQAVAQPQQGPYGPLLTPEQGGGGQGSEVLPGQLPQGQPVSVQLNNPQQAAATQAYINAHSVPGKDDYGA